MRNLLAVALLALTIPTMAHAKVFTLGDAAPVATIDVPDSWEPETYDNGVAGTSPDGMYMSAEVVDAADLAGAVTVGIEYFQGEGVVLDDSTMKSGNVKMGAYDVVMREWHGKDKDGEAVITLGVVLLSEAKMMLVMSWAAPDVDKLNGPDMQKMLGTVAAAK
jgi:hypothetical protein